MDKQSVSEERAQLLLHFLAHKVDHRTLTKLREQLFDRFQGEADIPVEDFKKESSRYLHIFKDDVEAMLLKDITTDESHQWVSRRKLSDFIDIY